ncbi:MAG: hypothetical protein AAF705_05995, partial [Bacteroidota bacterium]
MKNKIYLLVIILMINLFNSKLLYGQDYVELGDVAVTCASTLGPSADLETNYVLGTIKIQNWMTDAPTGSHWSTVVFNHGPAGNEWTRANLGEVFGQAIDIRGNIFAAATSIYGPFPFDETNPGGGVYKIDAETGIPTLVASLPNSPGPMVVEQANTFNSVTLPSEYPGLGNIAYSPWHGQIYVSNFEDGKIYQLDTLGKTLNVFDPMGQDDGAPGFAPRGERVWGMYVFGTSRDDAILYYGTWGEDFGTQVTDNTIRSVKLDAFGAFIPNTDQLELTMPKYSRDSRTAQAIIDTRENYSNPVSDLLISQDGLRMILAQRSMQYDSKDALAFSNKSAHRSRVIEYSRTAIGKPWVAEDLNKFQLGTEEVDLSPSTFNSNSAGGLDWGYLSVAPDGNSLIGR